VVDFGDEESSDEGENDKNDGFEMVEFPQQEEVQIVCLGSLFPKMNDNLVEMEDKHLHSRQQTFDFRSQTIEPQARKQ
jgi:hypothetical protein